MNFYVISEICCLHELTAIYYFPSIREYGLKFSISVTAKLLFEEVLDSPTPTMSTMTNLEPDFCGYKNSKGKLFPVSGIH